ncbi:MAG: prefoldin subunit [archaeon]
MSGNEDFAKANAFRQQLVYLTNQKQQLQIQQNLVNSMISELEKSKEKTVYKGVGNIFILTAKEDVIKESKDLKDTISLKIANVSKQEDFTLKKINSLTTSKSEALDKEAKGKKSSKDSDNNDNSSFDEVEGVL